MDRQRLLVISPVYNESRHIERVVRAMAAQTRPPDLWIIADDGSTDGTLEILRRLEGEVPFLEVVEHEAVDDEDASADRLAVALEAKAFNRALATVGGPEEYTHIGKLDGDVELPAHWYETLLSRFAEDPGLGLAGGTLVEPQSDGRLRPLLIPDHHVHGALKLFSRECFEASGGIRETLAWDTIDETYARKQGYATRSYKELVGVHLRPAASADGRLRGRARHGECAWILHYPLPWVLLRSLRVARDSPVVASGVWFLWGYARAAARETPRVADSEFRSFTRAELGDRVRRALRFGAP
jgi:hypothetical protein